ncbi:MAG: hypothetical protein ACRCV9_16160 [Burkholderiaceae bacterium]
MTDQADKLRKWEQLRSKGAARYILVYGVLFWGLGTAVLFSALMVALGTPAKIIPIALVTFPVFGVVWGAAMWKFSEAAYAKAKAGSAP